MATELESLAIWTFDIPVGIPEDVNGMLVDGEEAVCAYKTIRDVAIFTNKRLIVRDVQGFSGKRVEIYSVPYKSIIMYSSENAGGFLDINSEIQLWTRAGKIKINLSKDINIREFDKLIATYIL